MLFDQGREKPLILIVDDDAIMRLFMREALVQSGMEVIEAGDGEEALARCGQYRPDLVTLDVELPGLDGFAVCQTLRQRFNEHLPVVMITSHEDVASVNLAYEAGATDFITKPINWMILGHRIRYILRSYETLKALRVSEMRLENAQRIAKVGDWEWDLGNDRIYWSEQVFRIFALNKADFLPTPLSLFSRVHPEDVERLLEVTNNALYHGEPYCVEYRILTPDNDERTVLAQAEVVFGADGAPLGMAGTLEDISERKQAEETIRYLAYYDMLTRLPNRQLFKDRLTQAISNAQRTQTLVGVFSIGLDRFKNINETLGHSEGDLLLQQVSERLKRYLRESDSVARPRDDFGLARLGSDEFSLLLNGISNVNDLALVAQRIQNIFIEPFVIHKHEVFVSVSIGIAVYPLDGEDAEPLLKHADTAMSHAKHAGRNIYQFYAEAMNQRAIDRMSLENKLRRAIEREEFRLYYQPRVEIATMRITGVEALLRWSNDELGMVSPADFIPLAEDTGLIVPIGAWVLETAAAQAKAWLAQGLGAICVAVNLSSQQFHRGGLYETVARILQQSGVDPQLLELEITESIILRDTQEVLATLSKFKAMGMRLSMDDFGTGYSSLSYLQRFPLDTLKIDRSFVKDIPDNPDDVAITSAIIAMAHTLGLNVVAEGVETAEQLAFLRQRGCEEMQGFYFSRPLPAEEAGELISCHLRTSRRGANQGS
ncbi:MAG: EAL domain-containing protein [Pseudomonadota bacterium]